MMNFQPPPCGKNTYWFALEGTDGSGKSTQMQLLQETFTHLGYEVLCVCEPGGVEYSTKLRTIIKEMTTPVHPLAVAMLMVSARVQLMSEKVLPFLQKNNRIVFMDRCLFSTYVYQGITDGLGIPCITQLHSFNPVHFVPHKVFFLHVPLEISIDRMEKRKEKKDFFEQNGIEYLTKIYSAYKQIQQIFPDNFESIEANAQSLDVQELIKEKIQIFIHQGMQR